MGNILDLSKIFGSWGTQDMRIVMVGLDGAGKTTVCLPFWLFVPTSIDSQL
jgi:signal recognition particle GTPase